MPNPKFEEGRARLHEARRQEAQLAFDLMVAFIKHRQGDISGDELGKLMNHFGMPYPSSNYLAARQKAEVPLRKALNRHSKTKNRVKDLREDFREFLAQYPEDLRPHYVTPVHAEVASKALGETPEAPAPVPVEPRFVTPVFTKYEEPRPAFNIQTVSTEALLAELSRRENEATALLRTLGKLPEPPQTTDPHE